MSDSTLTSPEETTRPAAKAGSWYVDRPTALGRELDKYLAAVPDTINGSSLPIPGARIVIAPHAGYTYSGPCAAWAYKSLDLSKAKRVFVLGPSHTYYLQGCAVTSFDNYATPFGDLKVDRDAIQRVKEAAGMRDIRQSNDIKEHSLEMHLPYLYKRLEQTFGSPEKFPPIVPILIGDNGRDAEKAVGRALAPWVMDEENAFIVSSDFCHWGSHFDYLPYSQTNQASRLLFLDPRGRVPSGPPIHETIKAVDQSAMDAVESGVHDKFYDDLKMTKNTVCGRHPIGVMMAALEVLRRQVGDQQRGQFQIIQYDRSALVEEPSDSSVSYVAAYAVA
ncbi:DUF52 domain-containing protein [Sarocladium strictum]